MRYLSLLFFVFSLRSLAAQEAVSSAASFHFKFGGGFGYQTLRDDAMSPLLYQGAEIAAYAGLEWRKTKSIWQLDGFFWYGQPSSDRSGAYMDTYSTAWNVSYLRHLQLSKWQVSVGGALTNWASFREHVSLINSDYFYDIFLSLAPSVQLERNFHFLKRDWLLSGQLTVPVLTYGLRPNFSGLDETPPNDDSVQTAFDAAQIGSFDVLTNIRSRLELAYPLKNGNRIGLLYYWDFFQSDIEPHSVQQAMQSVQLNLHFKL